MLTDAPTHATNGGISITSTMHANVEVSLYYVGTSIHSSAHIESDQQRYWVVSHVQHGEATMTTGGQRWEVKAGEVMIHPPFVTFSEYASEPGVHQYMFVDIKIGPYSDLFRLYAVSPVVKLLSPSFYATTFETLQRVWNEEEPSSPLAVLQTSVYAIQLFCHILESWQAIGSPERPSSLLTIHDRFVQVTTYMANHLDQKLTRQDLADLVHLHPGYFGRVFHQIYGLSPMEMLREFRWRRALSLLEKTETPLASIAQICGLQDASYFSRAFRQRYGQTPNSYRESAKNTKISATPTL